MKLFQQLLVAPAALGLLAPIAANAAEVNLNGVAGYADQETYEEEVTAAQFSDVVPGDWAYTALIKLSESYGCVDNSYNQNLKSGQSLTRYEAAALVNACLEGGVASADIGSDALRLSNEFGTEMAILKGRIDGLEYKVQELSAGQFSSATKMSGQAVFTTGTVDVADTLGGTAPNDGKLFSTYAYKLALNSSFNGTDLLTAELEAGNADTAQYRLDSAYASTGANALEVSSLFYSFPVGDDFQVTAGPLFDTDDVISATTSVYSGTFRLASLPWSTASQTGPGAAIEYVNDSGFNASFSSISVATANNNIPATNGANANTGIWTEESNDVMTFAVGYDGDRFGGGLIYTNQDNNGFLNTSTNNTTNDNTFGAGVYFTPDGFPSISVSYDSFNDSDGVIGDSSDWMIALEHPMGPGVASIAYQSRNVPNNAANNWFVDTTNYELYYNYPVTDGIDVQAGLFVEESPTANADNTVGYMVETFFKF